MLDSKEVGFKMLSSPLKKPLRRKLMFSFRNYNSTKVPRSCIQVSTPRLTKFAIESTIAVERYQLHPAIRLFKLSLTLMP